jgi:hypothetical protein
VFDPFKDSKIKRHNGQLLRDHRGLPASLSPFAFIAPQVTLKSNINPLTLRTFASFATFGSNPLCFLLFTSGTRPVFYFLNIGQRNQSRPLLRVLAEDRQNRDG